ncbi:MAG: hypothetical protein Kow0069_37430 [Promethearchaeota archaeon]
MSPFLREFPVFRVMLDVDGVVADFCRRFLELADETFGIFEDREPVYEVDTWHFHEANIGLTLEQERAVLRKTQEIADFWETVPAMYDEEDLESLRRLIQLPNVEVYAVTARYPTAGSSVLVQTTNWLLEHVGPGLSVIPVPNGNKADVCAVLGIELALEDSPKYAQGLREAGIDTFLVDRPYNRHLSNFPRVGSLAEFCRAAIQRASRQSEETR